MISQWLLKNIANLLKHNNNNELIILLVTTYDHQ